MGEWIRVTRHNPCPVCGKGDWCTIAGSGLGSCCMRIESPKPMHNGGWWHSNIEGGAARSGLTAVIYKKQDGTSPDFESLLTRWRREKAGELQPYAALLGVRQQDLLDLGVVYDPEHKAFAFPMYSPKGDVVGIRLRNEFHKWAVRGSHDGLFIPFPSIARLSFNPVMICEGPTDTAAGMSLGYFTVGRPSNLGGIDMVLEFLSQISVRDIVVCYDNDEHIDSAGKRIRPGPLGAERLIEKLRKYRVARFVPPTKDLRSFLQSGGTRSLVESVIASTVMVI